MSHKYPMTEKFPLPLLPACRYLFLPRTTHSLGFIWIFWLQCQKKNKAQQQQQQRNKVKEKQKKSATQTIPRSGLLREFLSPLASFRGGVGSVHRVLLLISLTPCWAAAKSAFDEWATVASVELELHLKELQLSFHLVSLSLSAISLSSSTCFFSLRSSLLLQLHNVVDFLGSQYNYCI